MHAIIVVERLDVFRIMKTITFYSYKGGTGRSLLLANTARFLAQDGRTVVALDFDLEAPGLHFKFGLTRKQVRLGTVNILKTWQKGDPLSLENYLCNVTPSGMKGQIHLIPAGPAPSRLYAGSLMKLDWKKIRKQAEPRVKSLKWDLSQWGADYLLVDARTGITDVGALALHVMADTTVCLFTTTPESIRGIALIMAGIAASPRGSNSFVPVLSRVPDRVIENHKFLQLQCNRINKFVETCRGINEAASVPTPDEGGDQRAASTPDEGGKKPFRLHWDQLVVIRSDPKLEVEENLLVASNRTVRESMVILDYIRLFKKLYLPSSTLSANYGQLLDLYGKGPASIVPERIAPESKTALQFMCEQKLFKYSLSTTLNDSMYVSFIGQVREKLRMHREVQEVTQEALKVESSSFDMLAFRMHEGSLHFCSNPYYLTPARSQLVSVLPLGRIRVFGCAFTPDVPEPIKEPIKNYAGSALDFKAFFKAFLMPLLKQCLSDHAIGLLGETAASSEVLPYLVDGKIERRTHLAPSPEQLMQWVSNQQKAVVIADIDILRTILGREQTIYLRFNTEDGYPAGIMYPLGDNHWRSLIAMEVAKYLRDNPREKWEEISSSLQKVEIQPLRGRELVRELLLDMSHDEAMEWQGHLKPLVDAIVDEKHNESSVVASESHA